MDDEINYLPVPAVPAGMARLNITYMRQNGDLPQPVSFDLTNEQVCQIAQEAVRAGDVPGIARDVNASFADFVADPVTPSEAYPYNRFLLRPKTPFG